MENNIQFIEKEPRFSDSPYSGKSWLYPTYMVKDGKEFFVFNRRDPDSSWNLDANEARKQHLLSTDGAYFRFHGPRDNPLDMLADVVAEKHHFTTPESMYYCSIESNGFLDFHGNRREVSAAFHYRIYDVALAEKVQAAVEKINQESWEEVIL